MDYSSHVESISLTPGGVIAVLFNIQEITGQVITEPLELSFTKPKQSGQCPLLIGIITKPTESFIGKFHTVPIAGN